MKRDVQPAKFTALETQARQTDTKIRQGIVNILLSLSKFWVIRFKRPTFDDSMGPF